MVDALAVKVLGDGHGLVGVAQADLPGLVLHRVDGLGIGANRLGVGHQVHEGVPAGGSRGGTGGDILFIFQAGGAPVAVGIEERGQDGQPGSVDDLGVQVGGQTGANGSDLAVFDPDITAAAGVVLGIADQHDTAFLSSMF